MDKLEKIVEAFRKFPGIGPRQARRFVYHLLHETDDLVTELGALIVDLKKGIHTCTLCLRFFSPRTTEQKFCNICLDVNRDSSILMVLSQDTDIPAVEQRKIYNGYYFVIGKNAELGTMDSFAIPRLTELKDQFLNTQSRQEIREIILAMNANTEGEHTAEIIKRYIKDQIIPLHIDKKIQITLLGRGLSTGTELEYSDSDTLKSALENRRLI